MTNHLRINTAARLDPIEVTNCELLFRVFNNLCFFLNDVILANVDTSTVWTTLQYDLGMNKCVLSK